MDGHEPPPGQQPSVASAETRPAKSAEVRNVTIEETKPAKPRRKSMPAVINYTFSVSTPESYGAYLDKRESDRQNWIAQHKAPAPAADSNPHKRSVEIDDSSALQDSNKRVKIVDAPVEANHSGATSKGSRVVAKAPRNVGGRPRTHGLANKPKPTSVFLRTNKPVAQELCADVWNRIFDHITPQFLIQARQINRLFYMLLEKKVPWKSARMATYGRNHPDPPPNLTEMQYADLLTGTGCQSKSCGEKQTRKVYWAFQRRWCPKCIKNNTIKESDTLELEKMYPWLRDCLPKVAFDSWGRYCWVGEYTERPDWALHSGNHVRYSRLALTKFIQEVDEFTAAGPNGEKKTDDEKEAWFAKKKENNRVLVEKLQGIETYVEADKQHKAVRARLLKADRIAFFRARALLMDPPLSPEALDMLPKYRAAIEINKPPSERSWQELLPKILADRAKAEGRLLADAKTVEDSETLRKLIDEYRIAEENRMHNTTPEQVFVLALADKVIAELGASLAAGKVAYVDFVPLVFRNLYEAYDNKHDTGKPGSYDGRPYRLLLDDARMVYNQRIMPIINSWFNPARIKEARELKCPGCKRKDSHRLHSFENLMHHIYSTHRSGIGSLSYFNTPPETLPPRTGIAWFRLEWPRNLPILASHHEVTGEWDPNEVSEYKHVPILPPRILSHAAFTGRCVSNDDDPPRGEFLKNVVHAATLLVEAPLADNFKTQIVFKYALDKYRKAHPASNDPRTDVPVEILTDLPTVLIRAGVRGLFEGFHCRSCSMDERRPRRNNKFVEKSQTLGDLIKHYTAVHKVSKWSEYMFKFSSDEELWEALTSPGMETSLQIFDKVFPETKQQGLL